MSDNKKVLIDDYGVYFDDAMRDELMACCSQTKHNHINSFTGELNLLNEFGDAKNDLKQIKAFRDSDQDGMQADLDCTLKDHIENYFIYLASCFNFDATCYFDINTGVFDYEMNTGDYYLLDDVGNILKSRKFKIEYGDSDNNIIVYDRGREFVRIIAIDAHHVALNFAHGMCTLNSIHDIDFLDNLISPIKIVMQ